MKNFVSVIIPTFNRAVSLKRAIDSVFSQSYRNWEIIVVDNSSSDNTELMLKQYNKDKIKIIRVNNKGVIGYSRNIGIQNAKGEIIAFLDSDDWWEKLKLEKCVESLIINQADIVYHNCHLMSQRSKSTTKCRQLKRDLMNDLVINGNTLVTSSVVVKKKSLSNVGCFSEEVNSIGWEDYHLWLKLAKKSYKFVRLKGIFGFCWQGEDNFDNPNRVLVNLAQIEKYFIKEFSGKFQLSEIWWLSYTRGKAYLRIGNFVEAKKSLNTVVFSSSPIIYKLKSLYYRLVILPFKGP